MTKRAWLFEQQDLVGSGNYADDSNMSDEIFLGSPTNLWDSEYTDILTGNVFHSRSSTSHDYSALMVTRQYTHSDRIANNIINTDNVKGYKFSYSDQYITDINNPLEFNYVNNARTFNNPNELREVGVLFKNWVNYSPNGLTGGNHSFKRNFTISEFSKIKVGFMAKLNSYTNPINTIFNGTVLGGYLTCDFRFSYFDSNGNVVRNDLLGIVFSNPSNVDYNNNVNDAIFWYGGDNEVDGGFPSRRIFLNANKIGYQSLTISSTNYKSYTFDYLPLILQYLPAPPDGYTYDDAIITGLDIYSGNRGSNINFSIKNISIFGTVPN